MTTEQLPEGLQLAASLLKAHCDAHPFTHTALTAIRTAADRIADLETKCATLKRLHDAAADERDALREQINACTPHLRERLDGGLESPADMLAMREREVLGLLGRLSDAQMQGDALRARLAEIVRDLPLPTGERQAVLLTDEQIERAVDGHGWTVSELQVEDIPGMARDIEAAVLAANNLEVRRG